MSDFTIRKTQNFYFKNKVMIVYTKQVVALLKNYRLNKRDSNTKYEYTINSATSFSLNEA